MARVNEKVAGRSLRSSAVVSASGALALQPEQREHSSGPRLFRTVRVVAVQVAGRAAACIVHLFDAGGACLSDDLSREINLVVRRSNAGAELNHEFGWTRAEAFPHCLDRAPDDHQLRSFLPGMDEANAALDRINQKDGATVRNINT